MYHAYSGDTMLCLVVTLLLWTTDRCTGQEEELSLAGRGASFPAEVYDAWGPAFENEREGFVNMDNEYRPVGSGSGIGLIDSPQWLTDVAYVGSDSLLTEEEYAENPDLQMVPVLAGAVVLAYNLPGVTSLNLTIDHVTGIYNGTYDMWNDSSIVAVNPNAQLPGKQIRVVARADDSGTTEIFTSVLSMLSPEWNATYGAFSAGLDDNEQPIFWNPQAIQLYGRTNRGTSGIVLSYNDALDADNAASPSPLLLATWPDDVIDLVGRTTRGQSGVVLSYKYSIGYISSADAEIASLPFANIIDGDRVLTMTTYDLEDAMTRSIPYLTPRLTANLAEFVSEEEYPFVGYSYFIISKSVPNCAVAIELYRYIEWVYEDLSARDEARDKNMAPVVTPIGDIVKTQILETMTCSEGNVHRLVEDQKRAEWISLQKWRIPVFVTAPIVLLIILIMIGYIILQQIRLRRAILSDDWKISSDSIAVRWSRDTGLVGAGPNSALSLTLSTVSNVSLSASPHVFAIGTWQSDRSVCVREVWVRNLNTANKDIKKTLLWMRNKLLHINVLRFYGVTYFDHKMYFVSEHAPKGTLSDVIQNDRYRIDDNIKFSLAMDIAAGMSFLHSMGVLHGALMSECCFIDQRWNVKVADYEHHKLERTNLKKTAQGSQISPLADDDSSIAEDPNVQARRQLWVDPELLHGSNSSSELRKHHDVYSFSIILVEIFTREDPYTELTMKLEPTEIVFQIKERGIRPDISEVQPREIIGVIRASWDKDINKRPTFNQLKKSLRVAKPSKKSVMDSMMEALEGYVNQLEEKVTERTVELASANKSLENLLHQILPPSVANALSRGETVEPKSYDAVTIFFSDIVGFTALSAESTPMQIVTLLNDLYTTFDSIVDHHDVYKVETIGDAYMVISGLPTPNGDLHAAEISTMALDLLAAASRLKIRHKPTQSLKLRAGVHTGSVVAGVVGLKMPRYCLFGDTVNTASRMESTSQPLRIQVSQSSHELLVKIGGFVLDLRGEVEVKGKGTMKTYFLKEKTGYVPMAPDRNYNTQYLR